MTNRPLVAAGLVDALEHAAEGGGSLAFGRILTRSGTGAKRAPARHRLTQRGPQGTLSYGMANVSVLRSAALLHCLMDEPAFGIEERTTSLSIAPGASAAKGALAEVTKRPPRRACDRMRSAILPALSPPGAS